MQLFWLYSEPQMKVYFIKNYISAFQSRYARYARYASCIVYHQLLSLIAVNIASKYKLLHQPSQEKLAEFIVARLKGYLCWSTCTGLMLGNQHHESPVCRLLGMQKLSHLQVTDNRRSLEVSEDYNTHEVSHKCVIFDNVLTAFILVFIDNRVYL